MRVGEMKILAECFDTKTLSFKGKMSLFNLTEDPGEATDLASIQPDLVKKLSSKMLVYAKEAAQIPTLTQGPPWQGEGYYCKNCPQGKPDNVPGTSGPLVWNPWCKGEEGVAC